MMVTGQGRSQAAKTEEANVPQARKTRGVWGMRPWKFLNCRFVFLSFGVNLGLFWSLREGQYNETFPTVNASYHLTITLQD